MRQQGGKDERGRRRAKEARGRKAQARRKGVGGCVAIRGCRGRSGGKGVSRVPKERRALGDCVRQLFTTISLNRPRLLPPSPRPLCRETSATGVYLRTEISGALYLASSRLPATRPPPIPRPYVPQLPRAPHRARYYGKGAYLRRCAHITPADKLASLSSCPLSFSFPSSFSRSCFYSATAADFPGSYTPPLFMQSP